MPHLSCAKTNPDGLQGATRLRLLVHGDRIESVEVVASAGPTPEYGRLDRATARALIHCPVRGGVDGNPTTSQAELLYPWRLQ